MNGIESPILSYSDPIQFSQVPPSEKTTPRSAVTFHTAAPSPRINAHREPPAYPAALSAAPKASVGPH